MALKLKTLIGIFKEVSAEIVHGNADADYERFLTLFEDPDGDGTYTPVKDRIQLFEHMGFDIARITQRVISPVAPVEAEFEIETPLHLTGDAESIDDIEVSLKAGGLFKSNSSLKMKVKYEKAAPPEGLMVLLDKINSELKHNMGTPKTTDTDNEGEENDG